MSLNESSESDKKVCVQTFVTFCYDVAWKFQILCFTHSVGNLDQISLRFKKKEFCQSKINPEVREEAETKLEHKHIDYWEYSKIGSYCFPIEIIFCWDK